MVGSNRKCELSKLGLGQILEIIMLNDKLSEASLFRAKKFRALTRNMNFAYVINLLIVFFVEFLE